MGFLTALFIAYLFFHDLPAAASIPNNETTFTHSDQSAWVDSQNNVAYKPNPPSEYQAIPPTVNKYPITASYCSCVLYAKALTGFSGSVGYARNWPTNTEYPIIGGVVVTRESAPGTSTGHVAIIKDIQDGYLILQEANYSHCRLTTGRKLAINSPLIIGFWAP